MMTSKTLGLTGIVLEILWAAGDAGTSMICDLAAAIICDGKVLWLGAEFHCLPLQLQGACMEKGKLMWSKADDIELLVWLGI